MEYQKPIVLGVIAKVEKGVSALAILDTVTAAGMVGGAALEIVGVIIGGVDATNAKTSLAEIQRVDGVATADFEHPVESAE